MRKRIRPKYTAEQLTQLYSQPHDSSKYAMDHQYRVSSSIAILNTLIDVTSIKTAADLSAGDARIINNLNLDGVRYIGDFAPKYAFVGPLEETIHQIPDVDLFICSETLEHLDDPDYAMSLIASKAKYVFVSTPINDWWDNPEHYWTWDRGDVQQILTRAGYNEIVYGEISFSVFNGYGYQLHIGERQ